jgi:hypothetical protein
MCLQALDAVLTVGVPGFQGNQAAMAPSLSPGNAPDKFWESASIVSRCLRIRVAGHQRRQRSRRSSCQEAVHSCPHALTLLSNKPIGPPLSAEVSQHSYQRQAV